MKEIQDLLASPNEASRKKGIGMLVAHPTAENFVFLQKLVDADESVEIRFFARQALDRLKAVFRPRVTGQKDIQESVKKVRQFSDATETEKLAFIQNVINKNMKETLPQFIGLLKTETSPHVLSAVVIAIGKFGRESELKLLIPFLKHANSRIRANTIEALEFIGSIKAYPHILEKLDDPDNRVRANAINAMKKLGVVNVMKLISAMVTSQNTSFQASAAYVLQFVPAENNVAFLAHLLKHPDPSVRGNAEKTLQIYVKKGIKKAALLVTRENENRPAVKKTRGRPRAAEIFFITQDVGFLQKALASPVAKERILAITRATESIGTEIGPVLMAHFRQELDVKVISKILISLGQIQCREALPLLIENLRHEDARCRANAVEGIHFLNDTEGRKSLLPLLKDKNNRVRANAIIALKGDRDLDLFFALAEMAQSNDRLLQRTALFSIMELEEPRYYPLLLVLEKSMDYEVLGLAGESIRKLEDQGFLLRQDGTSAGQLADGFSRPIASNRGNQDAPAQEAKNIISKFRLENVATSMSLGDHSVRTILQAMETGSRSAFYLAELIMLLHGQNYLQPAIELLRLYQKSFKASPENFGVSADLELWLALREHKKVRYHY